MAEPHTCLICEKSFATNYNLNRHSNTHKRNRPKPLKCVASCPRKYTTDSKSHLKTHQLRCPAVNNNHADQYQCEI